MPNAKRQMIVNTTSTRYHHFHVESFSSKTMLIVTAEPSSRGIITLGVSYPVRCIYFLLKEQPSVRRALPPVGWQRTWEQPAQTTTVWACEKTVVMVKQPGHLTSMKKERGVGTRVCCRILLVMMRTRKVVWRCQSGSLRTVRPSREERTFILCLRASAAGLGLRRSTARTYDGIHISILTPIVTTTGCKQQ